MLKFIIWCVAFQREHPITVVLLSGRDIQIESLRSELELLRAELDKMKGEVRTCGKV